MRFLDRAEAGRQLARQLQRYRDQRPIVLGLPRGGVPVAFEVASSLGAPLDVWVVRKVGAPAFPELGVGAVAEGGIVVLDPQTIAAVGASSAEIEALVRQKSAEVEERVRLFREDAPAPSLVGRTVILVDDGIATGGTVRAAVQSLHHAHPKAIVLAVPVAASQSLKALTPLVDDVVCLEATPSLHAVGAWYDDFHQVPDERVKALLRRARQSGQPALHLRAPIELSIPVSGAYLSGALWGPSESRGLVLFAHGSGSSRHSPRNRRVAELLHGFGLCTLLFDLLTTAEEAQDRYTGEFRFDISLLARRLVEVTDWTAFAPLTRGLPLGYFGSSTGAAAALLAAAERPDNVHTVVSRGGRPDLALERLGEVHAPTLLIVGGEDLAVISLNRDASAKLGGEHKLVIVPGASHLFEEPGTLDAVARLAGQWFGDKLLDARSQRGQAAAEEPAPL